MSRKEKLLGRLLHRSADFTWDEATTLMSLFGFKLLKSKGGSSRKFWHEKSGVKVFIHEPHPGNIIKGYAQENLIEGLRNAGEIN